MWEDLGAGHTSPDDGLGGPLAAYLFSPEFSNSAYILTLGFKDTFRPGNGSEFQSTQISCRARSLGALSLLLPLGALRNFASRYDNPKQMGFHILNYLLLYCLGGENPLFETETD